MSTGEKNAEAKVEETRIIGDIRKLFASYGPTFVQLADGERSDMSTLLNFYGAPLRFIGPNFHMVMKDEEDITGEEGIGGEIGRLRHAHFAGSTLDKCDIKMLNPQAALVDALWLRRDEAGNLMERFWRDLPGGSDFSRMAHHFRSQHRCMTLDHRHALQVDPTNREPNAMNRQNRLEAQCR
jgi:hypothetical protein